MHRSDLIILRPVPHECWPSYSQNVKDETFAVPREQSLRHAGGGIIALDYKCHDPNFRIKSYSPTQNIQLALFTTRVQSI